MRRYVPLDVTEGLVPSTAEDLVEEPPGLRVHEPLGDFERHLGDVMTDPDGLFALSLGERPAAA